MTTATARVAPEKADFRPALLLRHCAGISPESSMTAYSDKLKDPRWQRKRLEILQRDDWRCKKCFDSESTLVVHHRYYTRGADPWDYQDAALVTLCQACHDEEHESLDQAYANLRLAWARAGAFWGEVQGIALAFGHCELLNEHDWSVIQTHLELLMASKAANGLLWEKMREEAQQEWKRIVSEMDKTDGRKT